MPYLPPSVHRDQLSTLRVCYKAPGVFQLGLARPPITIFSQQIRALRLADAIASQLAGEVESILVIGAGIAGVTFAGACLDLIDGVTVTVIEKGEAPFSHFEGSERRIHPHIYDWPTMGWNRSTADLPLFAWEENTLGEVADNWTEYWKMLQEVYPETEDSGLVFIPEAEAEIVRLATSGVPGAKPSVDVKVERKSSRKLMAPDRSTHTADVVVAASGFGLESGIGSADVTKLLQSHSITAWEGGYWEGSVASKHRSWDEQSAIWIVGGGDGAIIDGLSFCFEGDYLQMIAERLPDVAASEATANTMRWGFLENDSRLDLLKKDNGPLFDYFDDILRPIQKHPHLTFLVGERDCVDASPLNRMLLSYASHRYPNKVRVLPRKMSIEVKDGKFTAQAVASWPVQAPSPNDRILLLWRIGPNIKTPLLLDRGDQKTPEPILVKQPISGFAAEDLALGFAPEVNRHMPNVELAFDQNRL